MAGNITKVERLRSGDDYDSQGNNATATVVYKLTADGDGMYVREAALKGEAPTSGPALPARYSLFQEPGSAPEAGLFLLQRKCVRGEKLSHFMVTDSYGPLPDNQTQDDLNPNPIQRSLKTWGEPRTKTTEVSKGWLQTALPGINKLVGDEIDLQNAAGQPFEDALYLPDSDYIYCQQYNLQAVGASSNALKFMRDIHKKFRLTTNMADFGDDPKHHVSYVSITSGQPQEENGIVYYTAVLRLLITGDPQYVGIANRGYKQLEDDGQGGKKAVSIKEEVDDGSGDKELISEPMKLALDGTKLNPDDTGTIIDYRVLKEENYAELDWGVTPPVVP